MADETFKFKPVEITNLNDPNLPPGQEAEIDFEADAYETPAPPPAGKYQVVVYKGDNPWKRSQRTADEASTYYFCGIKCKIVTPDEYAGRMVFESFMDTYVRNGTSRVATLLVKAGAKVPAKITPLALTRGFDNWLKKEPKIWVILDWEAQYKNAEGHYESVKEGMVNFPQTADGKSYQHFVLTGKGEKCFARAKITKWLSAEEAQNYKAPTGPPVSGSIAGGGAKLPVQDSLDFGLSF